MKLAEITNSLGGLNRNSLLDSISSKAGMSNKEQHNNGGESFSQILKDSLDEVNDTQVTAYDAMQDIATGKVENLQDAIQKIQEAELSLKLGLEVKNKALGAYKQIMSMQI
jgi:flagellar hook-basal body complex protein FliE